MLTFSYPHLHRHGLPLFFRFLSSPTTPTPTAMKAVSAAASTLKSARNVFYSRPSKSRAAPPQSPAGGIAKPRSRTSVSSVPSASHTPSTPPNCPATQARRRRAAQLLVLDKNVRDILEEEYRDDVVQYMHEMEVRRRASRFHRVADPYARFFHRIRPHAPRHRWTCSQSSNGICELASSTS